MNHYLEPDSQLVFANAGYNPVVKGVVEKTLEEIRPLLATKAMGTTDCPSGRTPCSNWPSRSTSSGAGAERHPARQSAGTSPR